MTETLYLINSIFAVEVVYQFRWLVLTKACSLYDDDIDVTQLLKVENYKVALSRFSETIY